MSEQVERTNRQDDTLSINNDLPLVVIPWPTIMMMIATLILLLLTLFTLPIARARWTFLCALILLWGLLWSLIFFIMGSTWPKWSWGLLVLAILLITLIYILTLTKVIPE